MKNLRYILLSAVALVTLAGCDKWIDNAKTPSNSLTYDDLRRPGMMASVKGKTLTDGALTANVKTLAGQASSAAFGNDESTSRAREVRKQLTAL